MPNLLILTVGTGTKGKNSDLHAGLTATIRKISPRHYWLAPSADEESITMADLIRETCPEEFMSADETSPYFVISNHDDIYDCRAVMRKAITAVKTRLLKDEKLLVNPTSGTKQMSAGATLAALDEGIGDLVFTIGDRADGVVKTGTERLAEFSPRDYFWERDLRAADLLFRSGGYRAAANLLSRYKDLPVAAKPWARAMCMFEWQRLNYERAASHAALFDQQLSTYLRGLASDVNKDELTLQVLGDLLRGADALRRWNDCAEALTRYYKGLEYAMRMLLVQRIGKPPPFKINDLQQEFPPKYVDELRQRNNATVTPGLVWMVKALAHVKEPVAIACLADKALLRKIRARNEWIHEIRPVETGEAQSFCDRLNNLFKTNMPELSEARAQAPAPPDTLYNTDNEISQ